MKPCLNLSHPIVSSYNESLFLIRPNSSYHPSVWPYQGFYRQSKFVLNISAVFGSEAALSQFDVFAATVKFLAQFLVLSFYVFHSEKANPDPVIVRNTMAQTLRYLFEDKLC